jgi:hypothetical protein
MDYIRGQWSGPYSKDYQREQSETCAHVGESCRYHSVRSNTEDVGESAAVLVGTTVASTVSLFKAFCKGSGNDSRPSGITQDKIISSNYKCTHNRVCGPFLLTCKTYHSDDLRAVFVSQYSLFQREENMSSKSIRLKESIAWCSTRLIPVR